MQYGNFRKPTVLVKGNQGLKTEWTIINAINNIKCYSNVICLNAEKNSILNPFTCLVLNGYFLFWKSYKQLSKSLLCKT